MSITQRKVSMGFTLVLRENFALINLMIAMGFRGKNKVVPLSGNSQ